MIVCARYFQFLTTIIIIIIAKFNSIVVLFFVIFNLFLCIKKKKTFKFCHDPLDVYNFLGESHVLVELIQLGRTDKNEVLAWFETDAKDFLYPSTNDFKSSFHSPQRDVFMVRKEGFPVSK